MGVVVLCLEVGHSVGLSILGQVVDLLEAELVGMGRFPLVAARFPCLEEAC